MFLSVHVTANPNDIFPADLERGGEINIDGKAGAVIQKAIQSPSYSHNKGITNYTRISEINRIKISDNINEK